MDAVQAIVELGSEPAEGPVPAHLFSAYPLCPPCRLERVKPSPLPHGFLCPFGTRRGGDWGGKWFRRGGNLRNLVSE